MDSYELWIERNANQDAPAAPKWLRDLQQSTLMISQQMIELPGTLRIDQLEALELYGEEMEPLAPFAIQRMRIDRMRTLSTDGLTSTRTEVVWSWSR